MDELYRFTIVVGDKAEAEIDVKYHVAEEIRDYIDGKSKPAMIGGYCYRYERYIYVKTDVITRIMYNVLSR